MLKQADLKQNQSNIIKAEMMGDQMMVHKDERDRLKEQERLKAQNHLAS